jgi:hypothetical protein
VDIDLFCQHLQSVNEESVKYTKRMFPTEEEEASSAKPKKISKLI